MPKGNDIVAIFGVRMPGNFVLTLFSLGKRVEAEGVRSNVLIWMGGTGNLPVQVGFQPTGTTEAQLGPTGHDLFGDVPDPTTPLLQHSILLSL